MKQNLNEKKTPMAMFSAHPIYIATAFSFGYKVPSKSNVYRCVGFCPSPPPPLNIWVNNKTWVTFQ